MGRTLRKQARMGLVRSPEAIGYPGLTDLHSPAFPEKSKLKSSSAQLSTPGWGDKGAQATEGKLQGLRIGQGLSNTSVS